MFEEVDPFAAELALAKERPISTGGGQRRSGGTPYRVPPGPAITFAKSGVFQFEAVNPKNGKSIKKSVNQLKFVITDSQFFFQQWDRASEKPRMLCTTASHSVSGKKVVPATSETFNAETETKGTPGTWTMPYDREEAIRRYNPVGSRMNPETGQPLSCADCMSLGLNTECQEQGALVVYVLGWDGEDGEIIETPEPFIAHIRCPKSSARVFFNYAVKLHVEKELSPHKVVTIANIVPTYNGLANKLELIATEPAGDLSKEASEALATTRKQHAEKREREIAEWKANNPRPGSGGSSSFAKKPAAAAAAPVKKAAAPATTDESNDWDF